MCKGASFEALRAEVMATKNSVFSERRYSNAVASGSNGGQERQCSTKGRDHCGGGEGAGGHMLAAPHRNCLRLG